MEASRRVIHVVAIALLIFAGVIMPLKAQLANASIKGTVTDTSGAVVTTATVDLTNTGTGEHRQQNTNEHGFYDFSALPPGAYEVKATSPGLSEWIGHLELNVAQEAEVNPGLQVGQLTTTVSVEDVTPVIDQDNSTLSDVKHASLIEALPVQNRNFLNVLNFTPGVVSNGYGGQGGNYTRVNGIPGGSMDYLVDGQTASERYTNELQRLPQPLPTIDELKITTNGGNAEYSRPGMVEIVTKGGTNEFHGQLFELHQNSDFAAKSFHQSFVNFLVHNEFGGNFAGPVWIPKIYKGKDKTFFFVDAEGIRESKNSQEFETLPQSNWKSGDFSNYVDSQGNPVTIYDPASTTYNAATGAYTRTPFAGNKIPSTRINHVASAVLSHVPDPNINIPYWQGSNWQNPNGKSGTTDTLITAKVDQVFGKNRLSGRYTYTDMANASPGYLLNAEQRQYGGNNGALSFTELLSPLVVNEIRIGVQQFHAYRGPQIISPPPTGSVGLPTYPGTIAWPGIYFNDPYNYSFSGIDRDNPQDAPGVTETAADNLSWTHGRHELKFGFYYSNSAVNTYETGQPGGDYSFSGNFTALQDPAAVAQGVRNQSITDTGAGLADMLLGYVDYSALNVYPRFYTRQSYYAGYVQDNWRVSQKLTLNLGLRYEYWTPFSDKRGQESTLNFNTPGQPTVVYAGSLSTVPQAVVSAYQAAGLNFESAKQAGFPSSLWNMPKNDWAPRIGLAYQMGNSTVLRGGYGIYYWAMPLVQYQQNTRKNPPFSYSYQSLVDNNDPNAAELEFPIGTGYANQSLTARQFGTRFIDPSALNIQQGNGWRILPWDSKNYKNSAAQEWNITLEHQFPGRIGARVSYVGNHASSLVEYDPINVPTPRELAPGLSPVQRRPYPNFVTSGQDSMDLMRFNGYSNSNQLQSELRHTFGNGLTLQGSFVWARTLTTSEGMNNSYGGLEMVAPTRSNNATVAERLRAIYANDSELPEYTASVNGNYELPFGKGKAFLSNANGFVNRLVSGWNASGFYYWRSGLFFSPYYCNSGATPCPIELAPGKNGILPGGQQQAARWFDASVSRADLGNAYAGETYIQRANLLNSDFLNNIPRDYMTGPGFYNLDTSFYKITPITERIRFRLEAQVFNLLNHKNFALPNNQGVINSGTGTPRLLQIQAKIEF